MTPRIQPTTRIQPTPKLHSTPTRTQAELTTALPIVGTPIIFISGNLPPTQLYYFHRHHHPGPLHHSVSFIMQWPTLPIYCHFYLFADLFDDLLSFSSLCEPLYRSTVIFIFLRTSSPIYCHFHLSANLFTVLLSLIFLRTPYRSTVILPYMDHHTALLVRHFVIRC